MKFNKTKKMVIASVVMSLVAAATVMADDEVVAPVIVDQPKSVNVKAGARVTFSVNAVETTDSREDFTVNLLSGTLDMIYCAPGSFMMGSPEDELGRFDQEDLHKVTLTQGFWLGKYEVTQAQYKAVMGGEYPKNFKVTDGDGEPYPYVGEDKPIVYITWREAQDFCAKLTEQQQAAGALSKFYKYTLPTEAQWEYACRAGTQTPLYSGAELTSTGTCPNVDALAWYGGNERFLHPVGLKEANCWGFYDMLGNAEEMCLDYWIDHLGIGAATDPYYVAGQNNIACRGGCFDSWKGYSYEYARTCRSAFRRSGSSTENYGNTGFRVALVPNEYKVRKPTVPVLPEPEE
ncbi:MAG: formylglycine-generating enzyme family protein [Verrucomicrobia bacterium]|nr:formylglycine-generating enzyme family protein [Verrucomicrobiota bacterium]